MTDAAAAAATTGAPAPAATTTTAAPSTVNATVTTTDVNPISANTTITPQKDDPNAPDMSWKTNLGDLAKNPTIANVKSLQDLANMAVNGEAEIGRLRQQIGAKLPGDDAKPEDFQKFFSQFAPKTPDDYKLDVQPEGLPEGVSFNPEEAKAFAGLAHKLGLHPTQAKALQGYAAELAAKAADGRKADQAALVESYKGKWGEQYQAKVDRAGDLLSQTLPTEELAQLTALPAEAKTLLAVALDKIIDTYVSSDSITPPQSRGGQGAMSEAELTQRMQALQKDPAYFSEQVDKVKHASLRKEVGEISQQLAKLRGGR
jgi:hypothetical protein